MGKGIVKLGEGNWAVKDGNLLAAKETNGRFKNAEFTVDRGSDATYVNRDGLIKHTSSNIESEVFLNPNFDTTIPLGNTGSGWTDSGLGEVTFYNGGLKITGEGVGTAKARARNAAHSSVILETSRLYELTYTIQSISSKNNTLSLYMAGNTHTITQKSVGTHTILVASGTNANKIFQFQWSQSDNESIVFSSVSLKESIIINGAFDVDSDWSGTGSNGISISGGKINFNNTPYASNSSQFNVTTVGKTYKVVFTVSNYVKGNVRIFLGGGVTPKAYGNGTYTSYVTASSNTSVGLQLLDGSGTTLSVDNVSVFEINNGALPRIDFTDNTDGHLLLEPQSTNLLPHSENFSSSNWSHLVSASVDPNVVVSPDGTQNASRLNFHQGSTTSRIEKQIVGQTTGSYTFSVWAKSATNENVQFEMEIGSAGTGTVAKTATSDWQRFEITGSVSSGTVNLYPQIESYTSTNPSIYIWGAQFEKLSYATSYIPTSGSTVTRDGETCTGSGEAADFNSEEGVLYAEIAALADDGENNRNIRLISSVDNTTYVVVKYGSPPNRLEYQYRTTGHSMQAQFFEDLVDVASFVKVAATWKSNEFKLFINGEQVGVTETSGNVSPASTFNVLEFQGFHGKVKALRVYKETDGIDLGTLTSL